MINKKWFTPVRLSHLTSHAAVGAIIRDQNDWLARVKDTRHWPDKCMEQLYAVERVKQHLGIHQRLLLPPSASFDESSHLKINGSTIPVERFPSWMKCKKCGLLTYEPWQNADADIDASLSCQQCKDGHLEQVVWCAVSSCGGLLNVPWHKICHRKQQSHCAPERGKSYLKIMSGDRGKKIVTCTKCSSSTAFEHTNFEEQYLYQVSEKLSSSQESGITYTVMEVNDPRLYMPESQQALVIPPESNIDKNSLTFKLHSRSQLVKELKEAKRNLQRKKLMKRAVRELSCTEAELEAVLAQEEVKRPLTLEIVAGDMQREEYLALTTSEDFPEGADFITRHFSQQWHTFIDDLQDSTDLQTMAVVVDQLVAVDRLRVIEVFKGFSRSASDADQYDPLPVLPPDLVGESDWLPAIELFGEGIFFTLREDKIKAWESNDTLRKRAREIERRWQNSNITLPDDITVSPRFIMLHTLAHILIRELESTAGYPAASMKERIYCSSTDGMAGILIYTAVADIAGSLGGIVELAEPQAFLRLFEAAFRKAEWCSLDPVCGEMEGQGPSWLNRAACHACALIPDTACNYKNVLLDRVFIKGSLELGIPSLINGMRSING